MKTILITGINGYLGSRLAKALAFTYKIVGLEYSLENLFRIKDYSFKVYSIENGVPEIMFQEQKIDIIIYAATFYGRKDEAVKSIAKANLFLPFDLLDKAIDYNCELFINTDTVLDRFVSTYSLTKRHFQEWLYMRKDKMKVVNLQLEHFYGPGCSNTNFITAMIERLKNGDYEINLTKGDQIRDFTFIDDVLDAFITVLKQVEKIENQYTSYQVTSNQHISIKDLLLMLKEMTGSMSKLNFGAIPYRENELMKSQTDNSELIALGWKPKYLLKDGLSKTINSEN